MKLKITVHGVAYEVEVEVLDAGEGFPSPARTLPPMTAAPVASAPPLAAPPSPAAPSATKPTAPAAGGVTSPIAGTVLEIRCKAGDQVKRDQILLVIEAMKMNTSIAAPTDGTVTSVPLAVGDTVREGQTLVELE